MHTPNSLHTALTALGIAFQVHHHPAVHTVADGEGMFGHLPGAHIKNLFVKDKAKKLYLITALQERSLNLNTLSKHLGAKERLSFADEETLWNTLGVRPGSVSPLALINAAPGSVRVVLDSGISAHAMVYPHPLINTQTTALAPADLKHALASWQHNIEELDLGLFPRAPQQTT